MVKPTQEFCLVSVEYIHIECHRKLALYVKEAEKKGWNNCKQATTEFQTVVSNAGKKEFCETFAKLLGTTVDRLRITYDIPDWFKPPESKGSGEEESELAKPETAKPKVAEPEADQKEATSADQTKSEDNKQSAGGNSTETPSEGTPERPKKPVVARRLSMAEKKPSQYKLNAVPKWSGKTDSETIKQVCLSLKMAKELLNGEWSDQQLIYALLSTNERMDVFDILSKAATTNVEKFCEELKTNFCASSAKAFRSLQTISQKPGENAAVWFHRCLRAVHEAINEEVPETENVTYANEVMVRHFFLAGLRSERLRNHLQNEYSRVKLTELAQYALNYYGNAEEDAGGQDAIKTITKGVNRISFDERGRDRSLSGRGYDKDRSRSRNREDWCWVCGRQSHKAHKCYDRWKRPRRRSSSRD